MTPGFVAPSADTFTLPRAARSLGCSYDRSNS